MVLVSNSNGLYKLENELIIIQFSSRNFQDCSIDINNTRRNTHLELKFISLFNFVHLN